MGALRHAEVISLAYFLIVAVIAWRRPVSRATRARTSGLAAGVALGVVGVAAGADPQPVSGSFLRDWAPLPLLLLAYWLPGALVAGPRLRLEQWLLALDVRALSSTAGRVLTRAPRAARELLELAYLAVYPMVPLAFAILAAAGRCADADRFWGIVLTAEYLCYIVLPFLPTRPPREIDGVPAYGGRETAVRRLNLAILERASNRWNTFPSGHVAGAAACALAVLPLLPVAGAALLALALLIAVGSVMGRYHYAADAVAGLAVAGLIALLFALQQPVEL